MNTEFCFFDFEYIIKKRKLVWNFANVSDFVVKKLNRNFLHIEAIFQGSILFMSKTRVPGLGYSLNILVFLLLAHEAVTCEKVSLSHFDKRLQIWRNI